MYGYAFFPQPPVTPYKTSDPVSMMSATGALPDTHSPPDLLRDDDTSEVVDASDDACCFHIA